MTSWSCHVFSFLLSVINDVPVMDDTLTRVTVIGLSPELPLDAPKALKFVETLVQRAASVKSGKCKGACPLRKIFSRKKNL